MQNMNTQYNLIPNNSKVYFNGSIWHSNSCGNFTIIGKTNRHRISKEGYPEYKYYLCQFEDKTIVEARTSQIKKGKVRNPNYPSICGKGFLGEGKWRFYVRQKPTREYTLFHNILNRCYNPNANGYETYGALGVTLDENLFNFQNFCEMLTQLPNYDQWKKSVSGTWEIDKDILCEQMNINPKIYSQNTCMFIPREDNMADRNRRNSITGLTYIGVSPENNVYEFNNIKKFSREHNLCDTHVGRCIKELAQQHKGWKFYIKDTAE